MKIWQALIIGVLIGLIASAVLWIILSPPRGTPVTLLPPPTPAPFSVHVSGEVQTPGVHQLPPGSIVDDAIRAAGGFTEEANQAAINLAAPVSAGQKIVVLSSNQPSPVASKLDTISSGLESGGKINLNSAQLDQLTTLPGIGEGKAQEIIAYRQRTGGFTTIEEIMDVPGIGEGIFAQIKDLIAVE